MANVGTAPEGRTLIGTGNLSSPTFALIGTLSGLQEFGVVLGGGVDEFTVVPASLNGRLLQAKGLSSPPDYTLATYPNVVGAGGSILRSDGSAGWLASQTTWQNSLTQYSILYAPLNDTQGQILPASYGVLISDGVGNPSWLAPGVTGQYLGANTGGSPSWVNLAFMTSLTGNSGVATPSLGNINVQTANSTAKFVGSGSTLTQDFGLSPFNLLLGGSGTSITSGSHNIGLGFGALFAVTSGSRNVAIGGSTLAGITTNGDCTAVGSSALNICTGPQNTGIGRAALGQLGSGSDNIALGYFAGYSYTSSESSNIAIGNNGVLAESNTIRIGGQGSGLGQQNKCFIAGIVGITNTSAQMVTINSGTGQMGVAALPVVSVSGTANRIDSSGGVNPIINISASYVGQASITTLGTVATGTWNATNIAMNKGGTNASLTASNGGILYSTASAVAILAGTATAGQIIRSGASAAPTWSTSTYPATNAINTLLYASAANVMSALATANSGVLTTSSSGVPSIDTTNFHVLTTGVQVKGNNANTAPPAGFIGEQIRSYVSGVSLSSATASDITSISLTAGVWDISCSSNFTFSAGGGYCITAVGPNSASLSGTVDGDNRATYNFTTNSIVQYNQGIASYRVTLASTTSYYLVAQPSFASGTCTGSGRISATRVG